MNEGEWHARKHVNMKDFFSNFSFFCFLQKRWALHSFMEPQIYGPIHWLMEQRPSNSFNCISKLCYIIQPCNSSCPWDHFCKEMSTTFAMGKNWKMVKNQKFSLVICNLSIFDFSLFAGRLVTRREQQPQPDPDFTQKEILIVGAIHKMPELFVFKNSPYPPPF